MRLLVLGGTLFLGRHIVETALARGHEVTTFNRGRTNPDLFPEVEKLHGDRESDLSELAGRTWDAAIDVHGRMPGVVRPAAEVSEVMDERDLANYGPCKAECERIVLSAFDGRAFVPRPGLIVGPHDPTDRFTYWPVRVAAGGEVLAPGDPDRPVQIVDGRDLADWIVRMVETRATGPYNATGPAAPLTMGAMLEACRSAADTDAELVWVPDEFLLAEGVGQWMELPLWLAEPDLAGMLAVDVSRATESGLSFRPVEDTVRDTLAWRGDGPLDEGVGLSSEREAELLRRWRAQS